MRITEWRPTGQIIEKGGVEVYVNEKPYSIWKNTIVGFREATGFVEEREKVGGDYADANECIAMAREYEARNHNEDVYYNVLKDESCLSKPSGTFFLQKCSYVWAKDMIGVEI